MLRLSRPVAQLWRLTVSDDMLHHWVVVRDDSVATAAPYLGLKVHDMVCLPEFEAVLAHAGLLEPGTSQVACFRALTTPEEYALVSMFPGHAAMMRGILRVG